MAQVKIEQHKAPAPDAFVVEVNDGRKVSLREPDVLAEFRLVKILGAAATNTTYVGMCLPLIYVTAIDGDEIAFPQSEREVEALIKRLGRHGVGAVMRGVSEHFGSKPEQSEQDVKN